MGGIYGIFRRCLLVGTESYSAPCRKWGAGHQHTGLGSVYISQLENGKKEPGLRTIEILAISFDLTPAQLLRGVQA
jgi:hypothetical protein